MGSKKPRPTFAELVAQVPESSPPAEQFSYSVPRPWITVEGQRWHLRGNTGYEGKELHALLRRGDLPAFHEYMNQRTAIPPEEREEFWRRAVSAMEDSEYSDFTGFQYKSQDGARCLVVYESC